MSFTYFGPGELSKELFYQQLVDSPPPVIAIDTETISLKEKLPIGFAIATSPSEAWWFRCLPERDLEIELLQSLMTNPNITKVFANVMFDIRVMPLIFQDFNIDESNIEDILVIARLCGRPHASLQSLANELGIQVLDAGSLLYEYSKQSMLDLPQNIVAKKCADDARATLEYYYHIKTEVSNLSLSPDYLTTEWKVIPILVDMSLRGLRIDHDARKRLEQRMEMDRDYYLTICKEYDFNPASGQQTGYILAKRGNFLPFTQSKRQLKTNEDTLELVDDPLAAVVLGFKRANSILTKYLYPLREVDRLYTEYGLDTEVGRTKSSNFNMQNIPAIDSKVGIDVRQIFVPDSGVFTTGDFSQEHLRILMYMSSDKEMERVYYEGKDDGDIHISTMKKIKKPRAIAKILNYAIPYGADAHTIAQALKTTDLKWCSSLIDDWFEAYPDAAEWVREAGNFALRHGKALPTLFGRQIVVPEEETKYGKVNTEGMRRKGINYPILGSDGEVMKRALIICDRHKLPLAVQVHDSITCDGDITFPIRKLESIAPVELPFNITKSERWT